MGRNRVDTAVNNKRNNKSKDGGERNLICTILVEVIPNVSIVGRKRGKCVGDNDLLQQRMDDGDGICNPFLRPLTHGLYDFGQTIA